MQLAITSIQRDRAPWLVEWLAFHMVVGFNRFYLYSHKSRDGTTELLQRLAKVYPIAVHPFESDDRPQLAAYQHAWNSYGNSVDWMAFIDGDEFLFPTADEHIGTALAHYQDAPLSALGVYWVCYGSSGHLEEPQGLLMENFTRHAGNEFLPNHHIKSIIRGRTEGVVCSGSHRFETPLGTFDELLRPVTHGVMADLTPSYQRLRINHYVTQSHGYFVQTKQRIGKADVSLDSIRPDTWFAAHDRNEYDDGSRYRFMIRLKLKVRELQNVLGQGQL